MNKNIIYIVVAVLVIVIVGAAAGIMLMNNGGDTDDTNPTPTLPPSLTGASSVIFSVNETTTATGDLVGYTFECVNYNTATEKVRVDLCIADQTYSYILDAGQEKSWVSMDNGMTWTESDFAADWTNYGSLFNDFAQRLIDQGNTNDLTYTTDTTSITIYCVAVNETIPDSDFTVS